MKMLKFYREMLYKHAEADSFKIDKNILRAM